MIASRNLLLATARGQYNRAKPQKRLGFGPWERRGTPSPPPGSFNEGPTHIRPSGDPRPEFVGFANRRRVAPVDIFLSKEEWLCGAGVLCALLAGFWTLLAAFWTVFGAKINCAISPMTYGCPYFEEHLVREVIADATGHTNKTQWTLLFITVMFRVGRCLVLELK